MITDSLTKEADSKKAKANREIPASMQAIVFEGNSKVSLQQTAVPQPGAKQVLVKLEACGLCASNIPPLEGRDWFEYPMEAGAPGHEGWGTVVEKGKDVKDLAVGDRVAMLSYKAYAAYDVADENQCVKLPAALDGKDFPGEPLGCAMNIFERSDIQAGQTVAIIGIGFLGAMLTQLCKNAGARVIAISRRDYSLQVAKTCGADELVPLDDHWKIIEKVKALTGEALCDRVIEATGKEWPLNLSGELLKNRGKLIIAGFHQDGMRSINVQLWNWKGLDVINAHERDPQQYILGIQKAVDAVEKGVLDIEPLLTHSFALENSQEAFDHIKNRPDGFLKAILTF